MTKPPKPKSAPGSLVRCAIYRRVSSEAQGEKVSPEVQLAECQAYAHAHGYTVAAVYTDIERYKVRGRWVEPSGTRVDRPDFRRMLADGQAGSFEVLIAWKGDRLYRGVKPAVLVDELIEATGLRVELVKEQFDRKMLFVMASIGKIELENIRERTEMGHRERVRGGMHFGGRVPLGYAAVKNQAGRTTGYALDPAYRGFFDDLARLFIARVPYHEIARRLGNSPNSGNPWHATSIRFLISNPFYRGQLAYGWIIRAPDFQVAGQQPPAWDAATCAAIQSEWERRTAHPRGPRGGALFSGIARCGICGHPMAVVASKTKRPDGQPGKTYRSYGCFRPYWVRYGQWVGRPTHAPNFISEVKLLALLRQELKAVTPATIDAYLAGLRSGGGQVDDTAHRARLESEALALRGKLADLAVGLDGVRNASPAATEALIAAMTTAGRQLDRVRADLAEIELRRVVEPNLERVRANILQLAGSPQALDQPLEVLQPILQAAWPALYIKSGAIVPPILDWPE